MKRVLLISVLVLASSATYATDVGVSVSVSQPGFYGQINIGDFPSPTLIYRDPILISPVPVGIVLQPIYLHVPPGHEKHWSKHCREYNACRRPVYFVQDRWYSKVYAPQYVGHEHEGEHHGNSDWGHEQGHGHGHGHGHDRD